MMQAPTTLRREARIRCASCGKHLFTIKDTRFGLAPAAAVCHACTTRTFQPSD